MLSVLPRTLSSLTQMCFWVSHFYFFVAILRVIITFFRTQTCLRQPRFICERYWIRSLSQKKLYWDVQNILWACIQPKKLGAPNFTTTNVLSLSPLKNDATTLCKAVKVATLGIFHQMTPSTLEFWLVFRLELTSSLQNLVILMLFRMTCG